MPGRNPVERGVCRRRFRRLLLEPGTDRAGPAERAPCVAVAPRMAGKLLWLTLSVAGIGVIATIDYFTGTEFRISPLYYLPVSLGAWHAGRPAALALAALSAAAWAVLNGIVDRQQPDYLVVAVNCGILMIAAGSVGVLVAVLRSRLGVEHQLGRMDTLTGLPNRRAFHERGELLLAAARRYAHPVTLAYLDLDSFKSVNDTRGHGEGDAVLGTVGSVLRRRMRAADLIARLGGDEFAILMVETGAVDAAVLLERLRRLIDETMRAKGWPITVSIGAVSFPAPPASLEELVRRADAALYAAKRAGKGRLQLDAEPSGTGDAARYPET